MKKESKDSEDFRVIQRETGEMIEKMNAERIMCRKLIENEPKSEELRRIAIRTLFSIIEGMCYRMKVIALNREMSHRVEFSPQEFAMLKERYYFLDDNGKARWRKALLPIKSNIKFTFKMFARAMAVNFNLELEKSKGWNSFTKAIDIRHRITHPKKLSSLIVTKDDLDVSFQPNSDHS